MTATTALNEQKTATEQYSVTPPAIGFDDFHPTQDSLLQEVLKGLAKEQKTIPPKFFYDANGSKLFDEITQLTEYYPTRTEIELIKTHRQEMARYIGSSIELIELGSGSSLKVQLLLEGLKPSIYIPVDISREHLLESCQRLAEYFPEIYIHAVCADYSSKLELPDLSNGNRKVVFFPGSSIGNFEPQAAANLLENVATLVGQGGGLLIGVDLQKDHAVLNSAYNDGKGVTAAFNLNLLNRINSETGADFNLDKFSHKAFYNSQEERIEMHLVSNKEQQINVNGSNFKFCKGESIHTENSYKYSVQSFQKLAASVGFKPVKTWVDPQSYFSIHYLEMFTADG
ncbi:MAG: L-histidine N(alpha)-methyltransferase [Magnetococcales bacterium]|nr:L-histidine N(alpha)-methyltransferase [Magnetococcales bacterium]